MSIIASENEKHEKKSAILVVGRFGSGKSTLLNTLAGVHWKVINGKLTPNQGATDKFTTSRSVTGCTKEAVAMDITTFDGRELTVIDTVGYDDSVNAESFYRTSNLTEVMDEFDQISAVVIVVNSKDERLTTGFVESLACVPKSFKREVLKNIVLVFTKWNADDENESSGVRYRGFSEQVKVVCRALTIGANDTNDSDYSIPTFWVDNRRFKEQSENALLTVGNLTRLLDHVTNMPQLSCREFKEMRALSQFECAVKKKVREHFQPSDQSDKNTDDHSGFETFLFERAGVHARDITKFSWKGFTAESWSRQLTQVMQKDIPQQLPDEMKKTCQDVMFELSSNSIQLAQPREETVKVTFGSVFIGLCLAEATFGFSLVVVPLFIIAGSIVMCESWSKQDVIKDVVFKISQAWGTEYRSKFTEQLGDYIEQTTQELQACFGEGLNEE